MGPRHLSRGYPTCGGYLWHSDTGFNGAAASEPRIPRKLGRDSVGFELLQWGRGI